MRIESGGRQVIFMMEKMGHRGLLGYEGIKEKMELRERDRYKNMIFKISILALLLFSACGSEEKNTEAKQELLLDLQYPQTFTTLSEGGKKKFEEEVAFYQFTFGGKTTELIDRKEYRRYVFNDIPLN